MGRDARRSQVLQPHHRPRPPPPPPARRGPFGGPPRRWTPVGPAESVSHGRPARLRRRPLPRDRARCRRASRHPPEGAGLLRDKSYTGRIVLAGDPAAQVSVSLVWGTGRHGPPDADDRQADVRLRHVPARLQVPGRQRRRPDRDHRDRPRHPAHRRRVADARGQRRTAGGPRSSTSSSPFARASIAGPAATSSPPTTGATRSATRTSARPIWDPVWSAVQSNDVGTDEFMTLCRLTGVEPYITVNSGFGDARSAAEYVEYANGPATTPWGAKRAANGHPGALPRQALEHRQRDVGLLSVRLHAPRAVRGQAQPLRQGDAQGRPRHRPHRQRRHARHHDRLQGVPEAGRQAGSRVPRAGRLDGHALPEVPRRHGHDQRALLQLRLPLRPRAARSRCPTPRTSRSSTGCAARPTTSA